MSCSRDDRAAPALFIPEEDHTMPASSTSPSPRHHPHRCPGRAAALRSPTRRHEDCGQSHPLDAVALSRLDPHDIEPLLTEATATFLSSA